MNYAMDDCAPEGADEAAFYADQLSVQRDICEVIEKASRVLDDNDVNLLCWASGVDRRLVSVKKYTR